MIAVLLLCRDGGIDATIDHGQGFMSSKEVTDIYSTEEPQSAFHARVAFCLDIHNEVSQSVTPARLVLCICTVELSAGQNLYSVYIQLICLLGRTCTLCMYRRVYRHE